MNCKVTFSVLEVFLKNDVSRDVFKSMTDGKKYVTDNNEWFLDNKTDSWRSWNDHHVFVYKGKFFFFREDI